MTTKIQRIGLQSLLDVPLGQRTLFEMVKAVQNYRWLARVRMDLSIAAGAADGVIRNRGCVIAALRKFLLDDSGTTDFDADPRVIKVIAEAMAPRALNDFNRLANGGVQANTILHELLPINLALKLIARQQETVFIERDSEKDLVAIFETVPDVRAALSTGNDRTWTVNSFQIELGQELDEGPNLPAPLYMTRVRKVAQKIISGAASGIAIKIRTERPIAMLVIQQTAGGFEVADIIDAWQLRSDRRLFYDGKFTEDFYQKVEQTEFGGGVPTDGYFVVNALKGGLLGNAINPDADTNLTLEVDVDALSAVAGTNIVDVWAVELYQHTKTQQVRLA